MLSLRLMLFVLFAALVVCRPMVILAGSPALDRAQKFIDAHVAKLRPLEIRAAQAWWDANISGKDEDFKRKEEAQNRIDEALADPRAFKELNAIKANGGIADPIVARQIEVLYLGYLEKQVDPALLKKMVALSNKVEKSFNVFRAQVDGKEMSDSEVRRVLKMSKDSQRRRAVWEASKTVGAVVEADLRELVTSRNEAATKLGFKNYHALQLYLNEQNGGDLIKLFDELDELTREPFRAAKREIDVKLAADCKVPVQELRPWHYHDPFFQESPAVSLPPAWTLPTPRRICCAWLRTFIEASACPLTT
jgi:peptidyl-dipeptidase A